MKLRPHGIVVAVLLGAGPFALGAASLAAQSGPPSRTGVSGSPGSGGPGHGRLDALTRELDLSSDQQEKLREIFEARRGPREALHQKMARNRDALHALLESGSAEASAVGELVLEGRTLREEGRALWEAEAKAIRAILTPEQLKKFDKLGGPRRSPGRGTGSGPEPGSSRPGAAPSGGQPRPQ